VTRAAIPVAAAFALACAGPDSEPPEPVAPVEGDAFPAPSLDCPSGTSRAGGPFPAAADRWLIPPDCRLPADLAEAIDATHADAELWYPIYAHPMRAGDAHWFCARPDGTPHGPYVAVAGETVSNGDAWWVVEVTFDDGRPDGRLHGYRQEIEAPSTRVTEVEGTYARGVPHGPWTWGSHAYDMSAFCPCAGASGEYEDGVRKGPWELEGVDGRGSIVYADGLPEGPAVLRGHMSSAEGVLRAGKRHGQWTERVQGDERVVEYADGEAVSGAR
jgi:hypothetical protein